MQPLFYNPHVDLSLLQRIPMVEASKKVSGSLLVHQKSNIFWVFCVYLLFFSSGSCFNGLWDWSWAERETRVSVVCMKTMNSVCKFGFTVAFWLLCSGFEDENRGGVNFLFHWFWWRMKRKCVFLFSGKENMEWESQKYFILKMGSWIFWLCD